MKFLITGLGSIGQRHYKNLVQLGYRDIIVFRTGKGQKDFITKFEKNYHPRIEKDLNAAFLHRPDAVLITNPSIFHARFLRETLKRKVKGIFVEKPLAHSVSAVKALVELANRKKIVGCTGYNFRFHPLVHEIKKLVESNALGKIFSVSAEFGEYLPDWHPWEDYRKSYAAQTSLGGGVILTQSHILYILYLLFGLPKRVVSFGGTRTGLAVKCEDLVKCIMEHENKVAVSLTMDYYQRPPRMRLEIMGQKGILKWDYHKSELMFIDHESGKKRIVKKLPPKYERNDMFVSELKNFISSIKNHKQPAVNLEDGYQVLNISNAILKSLSLGKIISI